MKILMCKLVGGAWQYITDGMSNALMDCGHEIKRYENDGDWESFQPDLYIGCSGHKQKIPPKSDRNCKVAIHTNPYGSYKIEPNINESADTIKWVKDQQPDVVFGYGLEKDRPFWAYWEDDLGARWVPMPTAGDATRFRPMFKQYDKRDLDLVYIGGRWTYKATGIDDFLIPVLRKSKLNYELHGWGEWPQTVHCRGKINEDEVPGLLRRAKVVPCISEPHTLVWGIDLPERAFKAILSGAVAVHDPAAEIASYIPSVVWCQDSDDYFTTIKMICKWPVERRKELAQKQYMDVIKSHTYHHRMAGLMNGLGLQDEADKLIAKVDEYIDSSCRQLQV